ncbi:TPA: hypothetical protein N0F65_010409 [Lagenidium giganteum]|uniref:Secreted protein n=1 Tax=Lagenidium giganteum TaxID=4803 RepID=A0AAV2YRF1_9STRA|nr:TPA: hypothetical protein N0F65_010409 [Lagenidium giganteum]
MKLRTGLVALAVGCLAIEQAAAQAPSTSPSSSPSSAPSPSGALKPGTVSPTKKPDASKAAAKDGAYHMTPVRAVHARIQNDAPKWDSTAKAFYTPFAKNYSHGYEMALDGANTASVEGALMFMQAEGIDVTQQSTKCERKNNMTYVVFYEINFAQPNATLAEFQEAGDNPEYGPMLSFDVGKCTNVSDNFPKECLMMNGNQGTADIGPFVGGLMKETDKRAPYPDTIWFSFPSSCPTLGWKDDKAECRKKSHRVLCADNEQPDGVKCIFNFKILGYLGLDDLVGITANGTYKSYKEFCEAGNVEFSTDKTTGNVTESIDFWKDPGNTTANQQRIQKMLDEYDNLVQGKSKINTMIPDDIVKNFKPLTKPEDLAKDNPECYKNAYQCASKPCKRSGYSQFCKVCTEASSDCKSAPSGFTFPKLVKAVAPATSSSGSAAKGGAKGGKDSKTSGGDKGSKSGSKKSSAPHAPTMTLPALCAILVSVLISFGRQ